MMQQQVRPTTRTRRCDLVRTILSVAVMMIILASHGNSVWADTNNWISGTSASWFTSANWSLGAPPSLGDDAFVATNSTAIIQGGTTATANNLSIENGGVTVGNVSAGALTVNGEISVGTLGVASTLALNVGTISVNTLSMGENGAYSDTSFGTIILTGSNPTIQMAGGINVVVNSTVTGTDGLIKSGLGTLTLAANNTYSGGTTISLGTLKVGNGGTTGSLGSGDVTNNAALVFNRSDGIVVDNLIVGSGSLTQSGGDTLTLTSNNTYGGGTTISAGTLQVGNGGTSGSLGTGLVNDNSALVFDRSDGVTVSNTISGTGSLTQAGTGTLILAGTNSYSGRTIISSGTLQVGDGGTSGSLGSGLVSNNSVLVFDRSDSVVVSNTIGGTGSLTQTGNGTLTVVGNNAYNGGTVISAGTLQVGDGNTSGTLGNGVISNDAALVFNRSDSILLTNRMDGSGSLMQSGTGSLTLSNANTYSGGTWISNGGTLAIRDSQALGRGGLNVINGTLNVNQMVINVGGSYTQAVDGTLEMAIGTNAFGQLNIAGSATLNGTAHVVQVDGYLPQHNDTFTLVVASNGITGTFSTFTNDFLHSVLLDPKLTYNANDVTLEWTQLSFVPYAKTANQLAVARYLDTVSSSTSSSAVQTINFLDYVSDPTNNLPLGYSLIAPEELGAVFTIAFAEMDAQGSRFLKRANELRAGYRRLYTDLYDPNSDGEAVNNTSFVQPTEDVFQRHISHQWDFYVEPGAQFVDVKGDSNANGYSQSGSSVTAGLDRRVNEQLVLGGAVSYLGDDASLEQGGEINADTGFLQLYGTWFSQGWHIEGMLGGGLTSYSTTRQALQGEAKGNTDALIWTGLVGGGYDWQRGSWSFGPQAVIQYECASMDSFTETGSLAPLHIQSQIEDALYTQLGFTVRHRGNVANTWTFVTPEASLAWRHDYLDDSMPVTAQLANEAGGSFTVHGPKLGTDSVVGSLGITAQWQPTVSTYLNYIAQLGRSGYTAHTINAGLRVGF